MSRTSLVHIGRSLRMSVLSAAMLALAAGPATAQDASAPLSADPSAAPPASLSAAPVEGTITLYTSVTQDTVDAVLAALAERHPGLAVEVFRAPTGELDARIAGELRSGGIGADVLWVTDPLSLQRYDADGLLAPLTSPALDVVGPEHRSETSVGTRLLDLVIVAAPGLAATPADWADLADPAYRDRVAIPDPGFAGSAFAALGYFAAQPELGMAFYQALKDNGAVQVASPADIVTGVAEGNYDAGITIDKLARDAIAGGAPVDLVWPASGAIEVYSPVARLAASDAAPVADAFIDFLVSPEGQAAIASTGWQPIRSDVASPFEAGAVVAPDWAAMSGSQETLLEEYRAIYGD